MAELNSGHPVPTSTSSPKTPLWELIRHLGTIWLSKLLTLPVMSNKHVEETGKSDWAVNNKAFLVRLWRDNETSPWRMAVTHVQTKETQTFSTVPALFLYLHDQISNR